MGQSSDLSNERRLLNQIRVGLINMEIYRAVEHGLVIDGLRKNLWWNQSEPATQKSGTAVADLVPNKIRINGDTSSELHQRVKIQAVRRTSP